MLTYKKLARKPRSFQSFTGIGLEQFDFLSSDALFPNYGFLPNSVIVKNI